MNILKDSDVNIWRLMDKIIIDIPELISQPVYIGQNPLNGTYKRGFEGDYKCEKLKSGNVHDQNSEGQDLGSKYFGIDDLDMDTIEAIEIVAALIRSSMDESGVENSLSGFR